MKRLFDIVVSTIALVLLSPVLAATPILVRVKLGTPILFRQLRPGLAIAGWSAASRCRAADTLRPLSAFDQPRRVAELT